MDKWKIFVAVVLFGVLRGLLQRRHVKAELDERMAKARTGLPPKAPTGTSPLNMVQDGNVANKGEPE